MINGICENELKSENVRQKSNERIQKFTFVLKQRMPFYL